MDAYETGAKPHALPVLTGRLTSAMSPVIPERAEAPCSAELIPIPKQRAKP